MLSNYKNIGEVMDAEDTTKLNLLLATRQMLKNYRETQAKSNLRSLDDLFINVSRAEYERMVDMSIEALRKRNEVL